ncbi:MAG: hypothetical protein Q8R92_18820 [Deltaproteobacteria bacterium]|nr:hypothetical protein [Deltaproteobacteria bacterium]
MIDVGRKLRAVTPSDSTVVNCISFYVGVAGDVAVIAQDDTAAVTLTACAAGTVYPIACNKIMSTNTTATNIVAIHG